MLIQVCIICMLAPGSAGLLSNVVEQCAVLYQCVQLRAAPQNSCPRPLGLSCVVYALLTGVNHPAAAPPAVLHDSRAAAATAEAALLDVECIY